MTPKPPKETKNFFNIFESEKLCPPGYSCYKTNDFIVYYNLIFGELDGFPTVCEAIQIDNQLHVSLRHYNNPVPLPAWFTTGRTARLTSKAMLENFPNYLQNLNKNDENDFENDKSCKNANIIKQRDVLHILLK